MVTSPCSIPPVAKSGSRLCFKTGEVSNEHFAPRGIYFLQSHFVSTETASVGVSLAMPLFIIRISPCDVACNSRILCLSIFHGIPEEWLVLY